MRRTGILFATSVLFILATGSAALAQEGSPQTSAAGQDPSGLWTVANFAIFACLLGWFLARNAPRFFNARSADIQKAIHDATGLKMDADLRYSEVDRKMASIAEEIKRLRDQGAFENEQLHQQILRETEQQIEHIRQSALAEIEALRAEATRQARRQTARLTLSLAEQRLRKLLSESESEELFHDFIELVERGNN
jgi:F-type H+-transporting ATPase subunit b